MGYDEQLNLRGSLIDAQGAHGAVEPVDGVMGEYAASAQDLHCFVDDNKCVECVADTDCTAPETCQRDHKCG